MNDRIVASLPVEHVLVCPHDDADNCACRKPKPGLLYELAASGGIDLSRSFLIGDSWKDIQAGQRAGCRTILLRRPYNKDVDAQFVTDTLSQAVDLILGELDHDDTDDVLRH
jgi:D-glycero-D-manno-heptose 1,7-bisphosphate phosphatase